MKPTKDHSNLIESLKKLIKYPHPHPDSPATAPNASERSSHRLIATTCRKSCRTSRTTTPVPPMLPSTQAALLQADVAAPVQEQG